MEAWLWVLKGPVFRFALAVAVLGLARELFIGVYGAALAYRRANDKDLPWDQMWRRVFGWTLPAARMSREFMADAGREFKSQRERGAGKLGFLGPLAGEYMEKGKDTFKGHGKIHTALSFFLHLGVVIVPLLLLDHLLLWEKSIGVRPPALPQTLANFLTIVTIVMAVSLVVKRIASRTARTLSTFQDYALLFMIMVIFLSGYSASRPWNPVSWEGTMIIHVLAGDLLLLLTPFTKLSHIVLYPVLKFSGELGWKFPSRAGEEVALTVSNKEVRPI